MTLSIVTYSLTSICIGFWKCYNFLEGMKLDQCKNSHPPPPFCATAHSWPSSTQCWGYQITQSWHTSGRILLNDWSACRRGRYLNNKRQTQETNIQTLSGIRTRNLSNEASADLHLRPYSNRDRVNGKIICENHNMWWKLSQVFSNFKRSTIRNLLCYTNVIIIGVINEILKAVP